jgi:DNA-binding LacI/PurR family transcriptional regulator
VLLADPPPTGVVAANNRIAVGVFEATRSLGLRVPQDVSIASFDDIPFEPALSATLTTYVQPDYEMGRQAAELLFERLLATRPMEHRREVVLRGHLVSRVSVCQPSGMPSLVTQVTP